MIAALRPLVVALVTALLLASCTGEPEPRFEEPTETPSASDPTSSAAAEKEPWEEKSKAGAVAFARHWVDVFNQAVLTGDTAQLASISVDDCETCNGFMRRIDEVHGAGGAYIAHDWRVTNVAMAPGGGSRSRELVLRIVRAPERFRASEDARIESNPSSRVTFTFEAVWQSGKWAAHRLVLL